MSYVEFRSEPPASTYDSALTGKVASCNVDANASFYPSTRFPRVFAIGDVHGDYAVLRACLLMTECVVESDSGVLSWRRGAGGVAIVVLGDVVDRFRRHPDIMTTVRDGMRASLGEFKDEELVALRLLNNLAAEAQRVGSAVFRLVGNHEIMQADERAGAAFSYASPFSMGIKLEEENTPVAALKQSARLSSFKAGAHGAEVAACNAKAVIQIGTHIFVHGGVNHHVVEHANRWRRNLFDWANELTTGFLNGTVGVDDPHFNTLVYRGGSKRDPSAPPGTPAGILWEDGLADSSPAANEAVACSAATGRLLQALNANLGFPEAAAHIVVAHCQQNLKPLYDGLRGQVPARLTMRSNRYVTHTTQGAEPRYRTSPPGDFQSVNTVCEGLIWRMDASMSRGFRMGGGLSVPGYLEAMRPVVLEVHAPSGSQVPEYSVHTWNRILPPAPHQPAAPLLPALGDNEREFDEPKAQGAAEEEPAVTEGDSPDRTESYDDDE